MTKNFKGIAASNGIAIAKAYLLVDPDLSFSKTTITDVTAEQARVDDALKAASADVELLRQKRVENFVKKKPKCLKRI